MTSVAERPNEEVHREPAGVLLVGTVHPGVAAVFRAIRHVGAIATRHPGARSTFVFSASPLAEWLGWYSSRILANGWQPYDQPDPAAYMPLRYEALVRHEEPGVGVLLRQATPDRPRSVTGHERAVLVSCSESSLPDVLRALLSQAGIPVDQADGAVRFLAAPSPSRITQVA
jgi:hypothetical protein